MICIVYNYKCELSGMWENNLLFLLRLSSPALVGGREDNELKSI